MLLWLLLGRGVQAFGKGRTLVFLSHCTFFVLFNNYILVLLVCMCVCMCVSTLMCVCAQTHTYGGQRLTVGCVCHAPLCFMRQGLSLSWELTKLQQAPGCSSLCLLHTRITGTHNHPQVFFNMTSGDPDSCLCAHRVSTLLSKPSCSWCDFSKGFLTKSLLLVQCMLRNHCTRACLLSTWLTGSPVGGTKESTETCLALLPALWSHSDH